MHAIRQHAFGGPETLVFEPVADLEPGDGQVRIAVEAAGVHLLDTKIRAGESGGPFPLPDLPMTPGREVAGRVDATGPDVDPSWIGRRVVAHLGQASGGYAEQALAPVGSLHELPDGVSAETAVAMIGTGRTAMGILEVAALTAKDIVLVTAAAGGLGALLVQATKAAGAVAVGLAGGPAKVDLVREVGADVAVDYLDPDWPAAVRAGLASLVDATAPSDRPVTALLDGVGGEAGQAALDLVGPGGRVVMFGWTAGTPIALTTEDLYARGITASAAVGPRLLQRPGGLREFESAALAAAAEGRWTPLTTRFPLADAAAAHRALADRATTGKVVLVA
jgi:NADPH2:quinone reductase